MQSKGFPFRRFLNCSLVVLLLDAVRTWELLQVTTSVQMSTDQRNDYLMEENPMLMRPIEPLTLGTFALVCNFTHTKAAMVSYQHLYCSM